MRLPKHTTLKAALLTLAAAASLGAHAATVQDEAIAFATNNPMSLTVQGDDIAVNLTTSARRTEKRQAMPRQPHHRQQQR